MHHLNPRDLEWNGPYELRSVFRHCTCPKHPVISSTTGCGIRHEVNRVAGLSRHMSSGERKPVTGSYLFGLEEIRGGMAGCRLTLIALVN